MNTGTAFVGIDAAKTFHVVCVKDQRKQLLLPPFRIDDGETGFTKLRHCFNSLKAKHSIADFAVGVESTATYHIHIVEYLRTEPDVHVSVINPIQSKRYQQSELRHASTDCVSANVLADFMAERCPHPTRFVAAQYETAKQLAQHRHSLTKQKTATINRLREKVSLVWPNCERHFASFNAKQLLSLLTVVQNPALMLQHTSLESLRHVTVRGTQYTLRINFLETVLDLAQKDNVRRASASIEPIIQSLAEQALFLLTQIDQITEAMRSLFFEATGKEKPLLASINGVGEVAAMVITAAIGDPNRFSNSKQIGAYFGLNPHPYQSGTSIHSHAFIQKKGNSLVRYYLFNCVLVMIQNKSHPIARFYDHLLQKGKPKLVAITACMRKLATIMFTMLRTGEPFNYVPTT